MTPNGFLLDQLNNCIEFQNDLNTILAEQDILALEALIATMNTELIDLIELDILDFFIEQNPGFQDQFSCESGKFLTIEFHISGCTKWCINENPHSLSDPSIVDDDENVSVAYRDGRPNYFLNQYICGNSCCLRKRFTCYDPHYQVWTFSLPEYTTYTNDNVPVVCEDDLDQLCPAGTKISTECLLTCEFLQ